MACALRGMSCSMLRCRTQALRVSVRGQHPRRPTRTKIGMQALVPLAETRCGRERRVRKQSMELFLRPRPHTPSHALPCAVHRRRTAVGCPTGASPCARVRGARATALWICRSIEGRRRAEERAPRAGGEGRRRPSCRRWTPPRRARCCASWSWSRTSSTRSASSRATSRWPRRSTPTCSAWASARTTRSRGCASRT